MSDDESVRISFKISRVTVERLRDMAYWSRDESMAGFTERAIDEALERWEKKHGKLKPRNGPPKRGRPVR